MCQDNGDTIAKVTSKRLAGSALGFEENRTSEHSYRKFSYVEGADDNKIQAYELRTLVTVTLVSDHQRKS